jgi:hypothetical protein
MWAGTPACSPIVMAFVAGVGGVDPAVGRQRASELHELERTRARARVVAEARGHAEGSGAHPGVEPCLQGRGLCVRRMGILALALVIAHHLAAQLPVRHEVGDVRPIGQRIDAGEPGLDGRGTGGAAAAVPGDDGGDALGQVVAVLVDRAGQGPAAGDAIDLVRVVVEVDEARRHDPARDVELARAAPRHDADRDDPVAVDGHVAEPGQGKAAAVERAAAQHEVVVGGVGGEGRGGEESEHRGEESEDGAHHGRTCYRPRGGVPIARLRSRARERPAPATRPDPIS